MTKTNTIHIEPLDEGYVVTHDGKRKAMSVEELRQWVISEALELFIVAGQRGTGCQLTFTLEADVPRVA